MAYCKLHPMSRQFLLLIALMSLLVVSSTDNAWAQRQRKPQRAVPPKFTGKEFEGTFFSDVSSVLQGERPSAASVAAANAAAGNAASSNATSGAAMTNGSSGAPAGAGNDPHGWTKLISAATIEDMVKNSKLRLDQIVASPTKYAGGYKEARREFSLQALLFAIIEQYGGEVRWKKSAGVARESLARMAANAKVSSAQAHKEAKLRVQDLADLLSGNALEGSAGSELNWGNVIDRVPLMQLLEWAQQEHINGFTASKENFAQNKEELSRYAELVAVLGKAAIMEDMPDAKDAEYKTLCQAMIDQAMQISLAVQTDNADLARQAAGVMGQSCTKCHETYR